MKPRTLIILLLGIGMLALLGACNVATPEPVVKTVVETVVVQKEVKAEVKVVETKVVQVVVTATPKPGTQPPAVSSNLVGKYEGPETITDPAKFPTKFKEAPMLAALVAAGKLPPVEKRLPEPQELLVLKPVHEIGKYGGTWRRGFTGPADWANGLRIASADRFLGWDPVSFPKQVPQLAKDVKVSADGTTYTIIMRKGVKWSDGAPFTANDVIFWWDKLYHNDQLVPVKHPSMSINGKEATVTKIDDYTVEIKFAAPNTLFKEVLGSSVDTFGGQWHFGQFGMGGYAPAHYLKQFHPDFVDKATLDAVVAKSGFKDWVGLFKAKAHISNNPELPSLGPWIPETAVSTANWVLVRNPYYYGVDTEGNQLPYIDKVSFTLAGSPEIVNLRAIAGEYDSQERHLAMSNIPVFLQNQKIAGYTLRLDPAQNGTDSGFHINLSYRGDAEIAKWFQTADFRRALSLGIDRDQINEIFFLGIGVPGSAVVAESSPYSPGPEYRKLWSTYDKAKANQMLDAIGLTKRDAEGFRLRTDNGKRLIIEVNTIPTFLPNTAIAEMVKQQWAAIGIFANVVEQERSLWAGRLANNETQISVWQNDGSDEPFLFPHHLLPVSTQAEMGPGYGLWFSGGGKQGVQPTDPLVLEAWDLYNKAPGMTPEDRIKAGKRIFQIATDQVWTIGTVGQSGAFMGVRIFKNNMGNVPDREFNIQAGLTPLISRPLTFYFKDIK